MSYSPYKISYSGASYGSVKSYLIGFILSIALTIIPFAIVITGFFSRATTLAVVLITAAIQVLVHLIYFLHMNTSSEKRWNLVALLFTIIVIGIIVAGSLWIMYNLNINMIIT